MKERMLHALQAQEEMNEHKKALKQRLAEMRAEEARERGGKR